MAVRIASYHQAEPDPPGRHRQRGERGPAFEARSGGIGKDRQKMIEPPGGVIAEGIELLPQRQQLRPSGVLLWRLNAETDGIPYHFPYRTDVLFLQSSCAGPIEDSIAIRSLRRMNALQRP
jgi:hypothetical protein